MDILPHLPLIDLSRPCGYCGERVAFGAGECPACGGGEWVDHCVRCDDRVPPGYGPVCPACDHNTNGG